MPFTDNYQTLEITTPEIEKTEIKRLRAAHELYSIYADGWNLCLGAYEGGKDFCVEANLFKHQRENQEDYNDRIVRAHYINYCEPLVSFFTNFIFAETIDRNGGTEADWYKQFIQNVNRRGDNIDEFMRQVCDDMQIFGMTYILVDSPSLPEGVDPSLLSKADEADYDIYPYWCLIKPVEILDWVSDDFDHYAYIKRMQPDRVVTPEGTVISVERYTEWYQDRIVISEIDVTKPSQPKLRPGVKTLANTLGFIPLQVVRYKRSKRYPHMGNSFLRDFAYNNREIMNYTSLLQEFLYKQCFSILAVEVQSNIPVMDQEEGVIGTSNSLSVPKGANMPEYITPSVEPAQFIQSERESIKSEMFKRAAQDTVSEMFNGTKSSGFSQAQSFSKTVPFIASRADTLEKVESALMTMTFSRVDKTWDGKIKYKDRYEITNISDAITQLIMLARDLQLPSPIFVKEELKRLIHEYDGKLAPEVSAQIEANIDSMDFAAWQDTQKQALIGAPPKAPGGNSPAAQQKPKDSGTMAEIAKEAKAPNTAATKKVKT